MPLHPLRTGRKENSRPTKVEATGPALQAELVPSGPLALCITLALAFAQLISWGTLYYSFAVLVTPMQQELGWSKTALNGAFSAGLVISGVCAMPVGSWIDRHGGRGLMTLGSVLGAAALFGWGRVETLPAFFGVMTLMGVVQAAVLYDPVFAVLARLFGPGMRRAILTVTLVAGFAGTVFVPLTEFLVSRLGWRQALDVLALLNLVGCAATHGIVLGHGPKRRMGGAVRTVARSRKTRPVLGELVRQWPFWWLAISFTAYALTFAAITFHLMPLLAERGVAKEPILWCFAMIGPMQVAGRLILMGFGQGVSPGSIGRLNALVLPSALAILALGMAETPLLLLFAGLYGLGNGIMTIVRGTVIPELLGEENYGAKSGAIAFPANMAKALGPAAAAGLWAVTGSYGPVVWGLLALACLSTLGFWLAVRKAGSRP